MYNDIEQVQIVSLSAPRANREVGKLALFDATGTPLNVGKQAAHQADSVASTVAGLVTDFNALLAKLQAAGLMA